MLRKYEIEENNKLPEAVNKKHHLYEVYRSQITTAVFNKGLRKPRHRETNEEQEMLEKHESSFKTGIRNVACHGRYGNIHRADEDEEYSSTASDMADDSLVFYEHIGSFRHRLVHLSREKGKLQSIPVQSIGDNADVGGSTSMQHDCSDLQRAQSYSKTSSKAHTTMKSLSSVLSIHPSHNTLQAPDSTNYDSFEHSTQEIEKLRRRKYSKISNGQQFKQRSKSAIGQLSDSRSRFREFQSLFRRQCSAGFRLHSDMSQLVDYATQQKDEKRFEGKIGDNGKRIRTAGMYDDKNDGQFGGERKVVRKNLKELQGIRQRRLLNESSGNEGTVTNKDKQTIAQIGTKSGSEANKVEYLAIAFGSKDKNKQPSTNITIHLACDGINRISPPPVISNELDFDRGSFTSLEPDLELEFNDVIDVTQLEGIDEIETIDPEEFERKLKEERRRHKKRRKRRESKKAESDYETNNFGMKVTKDEHDDGSFKLTDTASMENHAHRWIKKKEKVVVTADEKLHDTGIPEGNVRDLVPNGTSKRASGNDSLLSRKADDVDCNRQMYQTTGHEQLTETPKTDDDSELEAGDKALKAKVNVSFKKVTDTRQSRGRKGKTKKITSIKRRSKSEKSDKEKSGERKMDNDTSGKGHQKKTKKLTRERKSRSTSDQRKRDSINNIDEFDMEKAKTIMKVMSETETEHSPPLDFENLPSIKVQLSKLLGSHQTTTGLPNKIDNLKENTESSNEEIEGKSKKNETENFDFTTRSLSAKAHDFMRSRLKKSISMPGLADLCKLHTQMDPVSIEELKRPINVPVYLPSFPQRSIILKKQFKSNPKRVQYRRDQRSMSLTHSDLQDMVPWQQEEDTTNRSELEPVREETLITPTPEPVMEREPTPQQNLRVKSPDTCRSVTPPKKKEIVKKEKKDKKPKTPELPPEQTEDEPSPTPVSKATTPTPQPSEEFHSSREASFIREPSVPELPPIEIPELPEIPEKKRYESKVVKKEMKLIEVTPELPPEKKKLPPPPKIRPSYKPSPASRRSKVAEAPVTIQEVRMLSDPLDFLAKYCIINPDRLPYYERVFNGVVNVQSPRYPEFTQPRARGEMVKLPPAQLSDHELAMLRDMAVISHAQTPRRDGLSVPEQYMEKLNYSIEFIRTKQYALQDHMHQLHTEKLRLMAEVGKSMDRDIVRLDYKTKGKKKRDEEEKDDDPTKKKKKKKKKKSEDDEYDMMSSISSLKNFRPTKASDITDEVIVSRMDDKMMKMAKKGPAVKKLTMEINRDIEKMKNFDKRVTEIEDEKDLVGLYCMDHYFNEQNCSAAPYEFRRQQSRLYQKLHPDPDVEMNIEEVEAALQQVNNKLLSDREFQYIYFVLNLPKREKINFRLFSVVAALSEKVTQMDPVIRKLINKVDYNALDIKMEKSKELFQLLQDETQMPVGNCPADILAVELTAGGLTPEHTNYVLSKFNREGKGFADFLDFVTYVPLFVEIHRRIIQDPFNDSLDV